MFPVGPLCHYIIFPLHNFIFTINKNFLIKFRLELDAGHSIICSPAALKNSWVSLYIAEGALLCINTRFTLKLRDLDFGLHKESLVYKIAIVGTVLFNDFIDFNWFNDSLIDNSSRYHHTTVWWRCPWCNGYRRRK